MKKTAVLTLLSLIFLSCSINEQGNSSSHGVQWTAGDSLITISGEAVNFALANFSIEAYLLREYQVATNPECCVRPFEGSFAQWKSASWMDRQIILPPHYQQNLSIPDSAEFYYNIGTFLDQFGSGWKDTFDSTAILEQHENEYIWNDEQATYWYDGMSDFCEHYRSLWSIEITE